MAPKGGVYGRRVPVTEYVKVREVYVKVFITGVFNLDGRDGRDVKDVISRIT